VVSYAVSSIIIATGLGMNVTEALRSIRYDLLEYIQKKVRVDFDNASQMPVHFTYRGKRYGVSEIFGRFRTQSNGHLNGYMLRADDGEVYFLYFQFCDGNQKSPFNRGFWVLSFRILGDRELMALYRDDRKMLITMPLKRVVAFHGHLCPELVIGCKACDYGKKLLSENGKLEGEISVIAENCSSAIDAIQISLGATLGNHRLRVFSFGKHNYTFSPRNGRNGFRLSLKELQYGDEDEYVALQKRIIKDQASLDDMVHFQGLLDSRIKRLLASGPEDLFKVEHVRPMQQTAEMPTIYLSCWGCGQQVLRSRGIEFQGKIYCIPCFQRLNGSYPTQNLH
jgi:formylmethanofuran dehydrogenase subunit E